MAEESQGSSEVDGGPASAFMSYVLMEDLVDKLKLLNYDHEFVREQRMKALNRHYFALQTNSGEQFYLFTSVSAWLARKCGKSFEQPQEFDDPNSTISNILDVARQLGIVIQFAPSKLKQGFGEQVVYIVDRLADEALKFNKFSWKRPRYPVEEVEEDTIVEDDTELTLAKVEEELLQINENDEDDDDDANHIIGVEDLRKLSRKPASANSNQLEEILEATIDSTEWKLELERVLPQLKVTVQGDNKDWRGHLDHIQHYYTEIETCLSSTRGQLEKLETDLSRSLDKIQSREKYLNSQLESRITTYRSSQSQLDRIKEQYHQVNGGVVDRSRQLAEITDELDAVKQEMDERSLAMTDGTPLISMKKSLARLKNEIVTMDIRIAVVEHSLIQAKLKERSNVQRDMSASLAMSPFAEAIY